MVDKKPITQKQRIEKLAKKYWKLYSGHELKHDLATPMLKIYSDGENYVCFYLLEKDMVSKIQRRRGSKISVELSEITEKEFDRVFRKISIELRKAKPKVEDFDRRIREQIVQREKELKDLKQTLSK